MGVTTHISRRVTTHPRTRVRAPHAPGRVVPTPAAPNAATVGAQRAGGSQDFALYRCSCGSDFRAPVSACVGCPACGTPQDW